MADPGADLAGLVQAVRPNRRPELDDGELPMSTDNPLPQGLQPMGQHRLMYRAEEAAFLLSISRSRIFELLRSGELRSVTQGRTRLIPRSALIKYVEDLENNAASS